jgi:hypothetical protein
MASTGTVPYNGDMLHYTNICHGHIQFLNDILNMIFQNIEGAFNYGTDGLTDAQTDRRRHTHKYLGSEFIHGVQRKKIVTLEINFNLTPLDFL